MWRRLIFGGIATHGFCNAPFYFRTVAVCPAAPAEPVARPRSFAFRSVTLIVTIDIVGTHVAPGRRIPYLP
jgi:hypothetical protein